jgi:flagellar biosynthetic protein FlhB
MDKARKEGNFPVSREFVAACQFMGFVALLVTFAGEGFWGMAKLTRRLLTAAFTAQVTSQGLVSLFRDMVVNEGAPLALAGATLLLIVLAAQMGTTKLGISPSKLAPDLKRLNPFSKITGLAAQTVPQFLQAIAVLGLVGFVVWYELRENLDSLMELVWLPPQPGAMRVGGIVSTLLWRAATLFLLVGIVDLIWQRKRYMKQLKMSKQEVREEAKEQDVNPHVKSRIRRLQRDLMRRQMMKEVPKATAVIVNPTHYAVAVRYSMESGAAPKVVAKGKNYLALRIRKKALEHEVPIVENPPLARALYHSVDVGQEIPSHLYRAVAEILAYIYRLMNGKLPG